MSRSTVALIVATALVAAGASWAQQAVTINPDPSGMLVVSRAGNELAAIELNAHGPAWQHAPQTTATADVSALPGNAGLSFDGSLPIPNTEGGAIEYTQTVTALAQGVHIEYDVGMSAAMRLNGLQVSINLQVAQYGGREVMITEPHSDPEIEGFPGADEEGNFRGWSGPGSKIVVAGGTDDEMTIELRAAADVMIQDLRQWDQPVFEIRFPAIMEDQGRQMSADDRFHLDLTVTFAGPTNLQMP